MDTGDLILFSSRKSWRDLYATLVELLTGSEYSHIGIVIKDPSFTVPPLKGLYILQSGWEPFTEAEQHRKKFGVMLRPFDETISTYDGTCYYRQLTTNRDDLFYQRLAAAHSDVHNLPYNCDPITMIKSLIEADTRYTFNPIKNLTTFWCSALAAYVYIKLLLLNNNLDWSTVVPKEFAPGGKLQIINGSLGPLVRIK